MTKFYPSCDLHLFQIYLKARRKNCLTPNVTFSKLQFNTATAIAFYGLALKNQYLSSTERSSNNENTGAPSFVGPFEDKYNVNENETIFVTLKLEPGDPIPTSEQIEWIKNGSKDMSVFPRSGTLTPFQL